MKKLSLSILGLVILLIPLLALGCETTTPAATTPLFVTTETYNAGINALQTLINAKANQADIVAQAARIDAHIAQSTAANTYTKGELYTRAEVDAAIAAAVAALKANQAWITGSTGGGTTGGSVTGVVSITTNPASISVGSGTTMGFTIQITNGSNQWKYIRPVLTFSSSVQSAISVAPTVIMQSGSYIIQTADISYMPALGATLRTSYSGFPQTGGQNSQGEFYLGPGQSIPISVSISVTSNPAVIWTVIVEKQERT